MFSLSKEAGILRCLVLVDGSFALLGILVANQADSLAVWLDALFSLLCALMISIESLLVDKLREPPSALRPHGWSAFEPLLVTLKGAVLTLICLLTLGKSLYSLLHGGYETRAWPLISYGLFGMLLGGGISIWLGRLSRRLGSPILATEQHYFRFDALLSLGVTLAFLLSSGLSAIGAVVLACYIDPLLSLLMVTLTLPTALKLTWQALRELLLLPAEASWQRDIRSRLSATLANTEWQGVEPRLLKQGRKIQIRLCLVPGHRQISSQEAEALCHRVKLATQDCAPILSVELVLGSSTG